MPKKSGIHKVLVIGSGPIVIGQAAEFDYAGTQACLALKEENIEVVLVNNNPATMMTDENIADVVYFEPLTAKSLEKIIEKERPDGLLATLGGQTGLNLARALTENGVLEKYGVELLGTPIETIEKGEDRQAFRALMKQLGEPVAESETISTVNEALRFADQHGYPVIIRPAYTLGGSGGGFAHHEEELKELAESGLDASPIHQCLIEVSIKGFKEIEYEVMRDADDTCITVCNMENIDPVGVHTGDSIVVAPSQTLTDEEYHMLRKASLKIIRALGVVGGCNIQFALDPDSKQYYLIEVNPRVSRSSALASKATGYPIAKIAAKLSLGYSLFELKNPVTQTTYASFEPALDYVVVKIPRWPFDKFPDAERQLGTQMKATGEVMAIGRTFSFALQKAVRSLEIGVSSLNDAIFQETEEEKLIDIMVHATDERLFAIIEWLRRGGSVEQVENMTGISPFFLHHFARLVRLEEKVLKTNWNEVDADFLRLLKSEGFSDRWLAKTWKVKEQDVREKRKRFDIQPVYKMVDTCAAEFTAPSAYYYSSYGGANDAAVSTQKKKVLIIGAGPIRIGQGIEFDYCSVHAVQALKNAGYETILVNNNPETVSTDYTVSDRLYFEPLAAEDVLHVIEQENVDAVITGFGGQTAISLVKDLEQAGVYLPGVDAQTIDELEDREAFYKFLSRIDLPHIPGLTAQNEQQLFEKASEVGYPLLLRPSYVIGGRGMVIIHSPEELKQYVARQDLVIAYPILIDAYVPGTEVEVDAVSDGKDVFIPAIMEHIEKAGIHSGDSTAVTPAYSLGEEAKKAIVEATKKIAASMSYRGLFNVQFVVYGNKVYVLEVNPRASRTVPMLSKITGIDLCGLAVDVLFGASLQEKKRVGLFPELPYTTVKMPVFSTHKLSGVDPFLGPEMQSTGELMACDFTLHAALKKALVGIERPIDWERGGEIFVDADENQCRQLEKVIHCFRNSHIRFTADNPVVVKKLSVKQKSFSEWLQSPEKLLYLSLSGDKARRKEASIKRVAAFTSFEQFHMLLLADRAEETTAFSIKKWLKMAESHFSEEKIHS